MYPSWEKMKKIFSISILIILLTTSANIVSSIKITNLEQTSTIYVDDDNTIGPWLGTTNHPYNMINQALENITSTSNIFVFNGTYTENIIISKSINLIGENKENTIINGNYKDTVIQINSDNVNIHGFTIKNSKGKNHNAGITIESNNNTISDCIIYRTRKGLNLEKAEGNKIIDCLFHTNGEGIFLNTCNNCEIINCELCHNAIGIDLRKCTNTEIMNSYTHENGIGIFLNYSSDIKITECAICDNNNNQGGCFIFNSEDIKVFNSHFQHNGLSFRADDSSKINVDRCTFRYNAHVCIYVKGDSKDITISKCDIIENLRHGVQVRSGECTVRDNNIYDNWIDGVNVQNGECNARFNWWGTRFGPYLGGVRLADFNKWITMDLLLIPWRFKPVIKTGADWEINDVFTKTIIHSYGDENIVLPGLDSDNDNLPDWWETKWGYNPFSWDDHANIDEDGDALNNFEECYMDDYDASPYFKDVFLEIDWMTSKKPGITNKPSNELLKQMKNRFKEHNINLHIDLGEMGCGEKIPYSSRFNYDILIDYYWDYFLQNDLNNPRKNIFHYDIIVDKGPGAGFCFMGWAHVNGICISAQILQEVYDYMSRDRLIVYGSMHELGHTFGLFSDDYGGNDNRAASEFKYIDFWIYRNYKSIMNYRYSWTILDYSDGDNGRVDSDDWSNLDYGFMKNTNFNWPPD